jgi:hypothetical protein
MGNPISFIDPDGRYVELGNLSKEQKKSYQQKISTLNQNKIFRAFYQRLEKSDITYTIDISSGAGGSGSFNPKDNTVSVLLGDDFIVAQELFHAYQQDLGVYDSSDLSVRETEGDIVSTNIGLSLGQGTVGTPWDQGIGFNYVDDDLNLNESVLSSDFDQDFSNAVDARISFYKGRNKENNQVGSTGSYTQANSGKSALALKKVVREASASSANLAGPRLQNGDYYEN